MVAPIQIRNETINGVCLYALKLLAVDVILGEDILKIFQTVAFHFGRPKPALILNAVPRLSKKVYPVIKRLHIPVI